MATVATRQNESSSYEKQERIHLTPTGLLMEGDFTHPIKEDVKKKFFSVPLEGTRGW